MIDHISYMERALILAEMGRGRVAPNPMVGCVLVKDGTIIGEGYHEKFGGPHAEVMAFRNAIVDPVGCSVYVNLEPCNIEAKTPPCTKFLIENSVKEVFVANIDPNPDVSGRGIEELKRHNIKTDLGILDEEAKELNIGFYNWVKTGRPWVIAKVAQSSNSGMGINNSTQHWITNDLVREHSHELRSRVDAILIGKNTASIDNPQLTVRLLKGTNPIRVIADTQRTLPHDLKLFNDKEAKTIVLCSSEKFSNNQTSQCEYIGVEEKNKLLNPMNILHELANVGVTTLLIEGGPKIMKSFYDDGLIDEIYQYTSPDEINFDEDMRNPIRIDDKWAEKETLFFGDNKLVRFQKNEVECLVE